MNSLDVFIFEVREDVCFEVFFFYVIFVLFDCLEYLFLSENYGFFGGVKGVSVVIYR